MSRDTKPSPFEVLGMLKAGNERFVSGKLMHPHMDSSRMELAGRSNQADHAYAAILSCADSRVPVEYIFDAGIMHLFIVRGAGNVCTPSELASLEYGLAHVHTPVLVVLGHTHCGAVTAAVDLHLGRAHGLERNILPHLKTIAPAVEQAFAEHPEVEGEAILPLATETNIWCAIETLFMESPVTRDLVKRGAAKVVGAVYDVGTGRVEWLPESRSTEILVRVECNPARAM